MSCFTGNLCGAADTFPLLAPLFVALHLVDTTTQEGYSLGVSSKGGTIAKACLLAAGAQLIELISSSSEQECMRFVQQT